VRIARSDAQPASKPTPIATHKLVLAKVLVGNARPEGVDFEVSIIAILITFGVIGRTFTVEHWRNLLPVTIFWNLPGILASLLLLSMFDVEYPQI
jgi:hypothetical protein